MYAEDVVVPTLSRTVTMRVAVNSSGARIAVSEVFSSQGAGTQKDKRNRS